MSHHDWDVTTFSEATAVKALDSHTYQGNFPDDWSIGKVPNGGIVCANFLAVAKLHFATTLVAQNQPHTIAFHADFLRRTQEGPCLFKVTDTKLGRQTSVIHISMSQGRDEVVAYITQSNLNTEEGLSLDTGFEMHPPLLPVDLVKLKQNKDEHWALIPEMPFASFRKASTKIQFHLPRKGQLHKSIGDEWIRLTTGEMITNETLGFIADMFMLPVEALRAREDANDTKNKLGAYWYPTVLLNIDFKKALPEEGVEWLFSRCKAKQIKNGRMDIELIIMDEGGDIVALSHHVCLVVSAERNMAPRRDESKI